ncbi:uncharacterized protein LOC130567287 [Triplophysa rosa]|uniref:uncharacterized protein LOC130567287 n=1 Tax=Triplophysa rosa TaxID=992332 RepID=UPI002545EBFB|nr:uncharacterized protein LOC130567287 [Triplophysa rosa]
MAAQQLPFQNLLQYADLKKAILELVGLSPEQHRQRFRSLELGECGHPFSFSHQLRDACRRWLMADGSYFNTILDKVTLEQFVGQLPRETAQWVQCHRPTSLYPYHLFLSLYPLCPPPLPPNLSLFLGPGGSFLPRPAPRTRTSPGMGSLGAVRTPGRSASQYCTGPNASPVPPPSPRQFVGLLPAARAAGTPGSRQPTGCPRSRRAVSDTLIGEETVKSRTTKDWRQRETGWEPRKCPRGSR